MKELHSEGLAIHADPESCATGREVRGEALTGVCTGRVLSLEKENKDWDADAVLVCGRQHSGYRQGKISRSPTWSKTPSAHRNPTHRNREVPCLSAAV